MNTSDATITHLQTLFRDLAIFEDAHKKWMDTKANAVQDNDRPKAAEAQEAIQSWGSFVVRTREQIDSILQDEYSKYPPQHARHFSQLKQFHRKVSFEKSVVIMTKFPHVKNQTTLDLQLDKIIACVEAAVREAKFEPRIATGTSRFYNQLWDNVELHLLGSRLGIAIVETKYSHGPNPNVAMEWGWMRAMGRQVLYLKEATYTDARADFQGLLVSEFDWERPHETIPQAVQQFLNSH